MWTLLMIAKGAAVSVTSLAGMAAVALGMVWLLFGRDALTGDRHAAQEVTMSIGAGGFAVLVAAFLVAFVVFPVGGR